MRQLFTNRGLTIAAGHAVSGIADEAQCMRVMSGRVWITVEGVSHDYWLHAGDSVELIPGALIVMEADGGTGRVELLGGKTGPALPSLASGARYLARLAQRFGRNRNAGVSLSPCTC